MSHFDPYAELDLPRDAPPETVKRAYRRRSKQTHPDAGGSKRAFERTARAYLILSDSSRRSRFDATGDADEVTPDNSVAQALNVVVGFFAHVAQSYALGMTSDPSKLDLVAQARRQFNAQIKELENKKKPLEKAAKCLRDIEKRLKGPPSPMLRMAIKNQAASTAEPIAALERTITAHKDALALLKEFSFDFEKDEKTEDILARRSVWNFS